MPKIPGWSRDSELEKGVTVKAWSNDNQPRTSVRIAQSEGGHSMKCPAGSWQVNVAGSHRERCFETREEAEDWAVEFMRRHKNGI